MQKIYLEIYECFAEETSILGYVCRLIHYIRINNAIYNIIDNTV